MSAAGSGWRRLRRSTQHLNDNIEHSVKHMGFAGQHRRNGDRRIELGAGNRAEYQGGGGVHQTCHRKAMNAI